ncbi:hypothetical protein KSS87_023034 [Heliosperma pusillum]|nr:hypothetical protein KSS87_023034 [Heliosperma pusillum]
MDGYGVGLTGLTEIAIGVVAVFDGHNGSEASEMASNLLLEYLILHTFFLLDESFPSFLKKVFGRLSNKEVVALSSQMFSSHLVEQDRYSPSAFLFLGFIVFLSTAMLLERLPMLPACNADDFPTFTFFVLMVDDQILVANLGDSKALLCSEKYLSPTDAKATAVRMYMQKRRGGEILRFKDCESCKMVNSETVTHLIVKELTRDHRPDRDDEKSRVESAGGYVSEWSGVPRVNGRLTVSRAIGDVSFKRFGVSSSPEVTDWQLLNASDSYLIAASDGVFEGMDTQDVCDLLWEMRNNDPSRSQVSSSCSDSLADCIVNTAFERGSADNMAAAVVPLRSIAEEVPTGLVHLEHSYPFAAKFDRFLIEGKYGYFGCYYLYENLKETEDTHSHEEYEKPEDDYDTLYALPGKFDYSCGVNFGLNEDDNLCFPFGMISDGNGDDRRYFEDFSSFLALLESIPLHHSGSNFGSFEHDEPKSRYILRKRFGRGAYGEVWLAFQWNCTHAENASNKNQKDRASSRYHINLESCDDMSEESSSGNCPDGSSANKLFILKRIMVERGSSVYLSGLREKYFGEVFLNASTSLGGFLPSTVSSSFLNHSGLYSYGSFQRAKVIQETDSESTEDTFIHGNRTWTVVYEDGLNHIARYIESFESQSNEIWLVFRHEGISLSKLMYTAEDAYEISSERAGHAQVLHPSKWWHWLKTTKAGQDEMKNLIWQLLMALKSCHDRNITHRDIKPENMVICIEDQGTAGCLKGRPNAVLERAGRMRIIDFGSAVDDFTMRRFYGFKGPSRAEQTYEYTPPEALLNVSWFQGPSSRNLKYDMWSVGVVFLEIVLGSPDVFQISSLSHVLLDKLLEGWNEDLKELAYRLRSFMEMCILVPGLSPKHNSNGGTSDQVKDSPASWKCSEEFFSNLIKNRDPLKLGFPNVWAMRLVRQLLRWDPVQRRHIKKMMEAPLLVANCEHVREYASPTVTQHILCHDQEKAALLKFKQNFLIDCAATTPPSAFPKMHSWREQAVVVNGSSVADYCAWDGLCDWPGPQ